MVIVVGKVVLMAAAVVVEKKGEGGFGKIGQGERR